MDLIADMINSVMDTTNNMTHFDILLTSDILKESEEENGDYSL